MCVKTWTKRLSIIAVSAGVLIALAALLLLVVIDPNAYKEPLAEQVKRRYDRTLRIDGDVRLALFPRLGLDIGRASLSEPGRPDSVFASFDSAKVTVGLWPLLSRQIVLDYVQVAGLQANLVREADGGLNFDDLLGRADAPADAQPVPVPVPGTTEKPLLVDIVGLSVSGGLTWHDPQRDRLLKIDKLRATTGRITPDKPFDIDVAAQVQGEQPRVAVSMQAQGALTFDAAFQKFSLRKLDFKMSGELPQAKVSTLTVRGNADIDTANHTFSGSNLSLAFDGDTTGTTPVSKVALRVEALSAALAPATGQWSVERLGVTARGTVGEDNLDLMLDVPAVRLDGTAAPTDVANGRLTVSGRRRADLRLGMSGLRSAPDLLHADTLSIDGTVRDDTRTLTVKFASPLDFVWSARKVALPALDAGLRIEGPALPPKGWQASVRGQVEVNGAAEQASSALKLSGEAGNIDVSARLKSFSHPQIGFTVAADTLDLDKWWPRARAVVPVEPPKPQPPRPAAAPATPAAASTPPKPRTSVSAARVIDLSAFTRFDLDGTIRAGQLVLRGLQASDFNARLRVHDGRAELDSLRAKLYDGTLSGRLSADSNGNRFTIDTELRDVSIEPLLRAAVGRDGLSGRGRVTLALRTQGQTMGAVRASTEGTAHLALRDGAVRGLNLAQSLREFKARIGRDEDTAQSDFTRSTDFSQFDADLQIGKGVGTVTELDLRAPLLRVSAGEPARIDFVGDRYDLVLRANAVGSLQGQDGAELALLRHVAIPLHVTGTLSVPVYRILWSQVGQEVLGQRLRDALGDRFGGDAKAAEEKLDSVIGDRLKRFLGR